MGVRFAELTMNLPPSHRVLVISKAQPASYPLDIGGSFLRYKASEVLYGISPPPYTIVKWRLIKHSDTLTLNYIVTRKGDVRDL
jgi:hypothetical protein